MSEAPYSVSRGHKIVDGRWLLTHSEWHPCGMFGDIGQPETGVRNLDSNGVSIDGSFSLIQHGCWNFEAAEDLIIRCLRKGRNSEQIANLFRWLEERGCKVGAVKGRTI